VSAVTGAVLESELAEIALSTDLIKLEQGLFSDRHEMAVLVEEALASVAILRSSGFSRGAEALEEIEAALRSLRKSAR
jgi:hypothetical protein